MSSDLELKVWDLTAFQPLAFDVEGATGVLRAATARNLAAGDADLTNAVEAARGFLRAPAELLTVREVLQETDDSASASKFVQGIAGPAHDAKRSFLELKRSLGMKARASVAGAPSGDEAYLRALAAEATLLPGKEAVGWWALAEAHGFDALGELHRVELRRAFDRAATADDAQVSLENWRALLGHRDPAVRRRVRARRLRVAQDSRELLEPLKRARTSFVHERARLLGHATPLDRELQRWRVSGQAISALRSLDARTRLLADRFYRYKRARLQLPELLECDVLAPTGDIDPEELSLQRLSDVLLSELASRAPAWAGLLGAVLAGPTLLTDPARSRSPGWFAWGGTASALPLVHIPYHRTRECYAAAAHELGHACHLTELLRTRGELVASDESLVFQETFALFFELTALNETLTRAKDARSARFWTEALLEQGLHFLRTLPIMAHADSQLATGLEPSEAFRVAHQALSPSWLALAPGEETTCLLQTHSEQMPFFGYGYQLAFLLGYLAFLEPGGLAALADGAACASIDDAAQAAFGRSIKDTAAFEAVFVHLEGLAERLEA